MPAGGRDIAGAERQPFLERLRAVSRLGCGPLRLPAGGVDPCQGAGRRRARKQADGRSGVGSGAAFGPDQCDLVAPCVCQLAGHQVAGDIASPV